MTEPTVEQKKTARDRFFEHWSKRSSKYLAEPADWVSVINHNGTLLLADTQGLPLDYNFVMLLRDIIDESYADLDEEAVHKVFMERAEARKLIAPAPSSGHKPSKPGFVYLLISGGRYKIGRTSGRLQVRIAQIQRVTPWHIELVTKIKTKDPQRVEADLHERFAAKRLAGEWFDLTPGDVAYIKALGGDA